MPDITMCKGNDCKRKDNCYRHVAKPTPHWQSYFVDTPLKGKDCEYYLPVYDKKRKR